MHLTQEQLRERFIDVRAYSLDEWLILMKSSYIDESKLFHKFSFPSRKIKEEYLLTIGSRSISEIKWLIRCFLPSEGWYGVDHENMVHFLAASMERNIPHAEEEATLSYADFRHLTAIRSQFETPLFEEEVEAYVEDNVTQVGDCASCSG